MLDLVCIHPMVNMQFWARN